MTGSVKIINYYTLIQNKWLYSLWLLTRWLLQNCRILLTFDYNGSKDKKRKKWEKAAFCISTFKKGLETNDVRVIYPNEQILLWWIRTKPYEGGTRERKKKKKKRQQNHQIYIYRIKEKQVHFKIFVCWVE